MSFDVIIDGANISHVTSTKIVAARIEHAIDGLSTFGLEAHAILPQYMYNGKNKNKNVTDVSVIDRLLSAKKISLVNVDDDNILISAAFDADSLILSNDSFSDHISKSWCTLELRDFIKDRRLSFCFVEDRFIIPLSDRCKINKYHIEKKGHILEQNTETKVVDIPNFKELVVKNPTCSSIPTEKLPEPVTKLLGIVSDSKKHRLSDVSSKLKKEAGFSINDIFGNTKRASLFLEIRGFEITVKNDQCYVTRSATA
ncbi:NYN domain-containing protein [Methanolobus chelungpuianus]|uniref:RNase NYN domain-containing protein n=1 Tax=Methanolobus chelungpuianus TaxID=502115 RepID=A0AAE3HC78_9EURY|nr:hypothetical protein [Methanolobus chelungpuianus]MCQ6963676.1 hypothetical protein [Methanolobus chelungpuianus]